MKQRYVFPVMVVLSAALVMGQTAAAPGEQMAPAESLNALLGVVEQQMMGAAEAMPADKYGFAPSDAIFAASQKTNYAGVRTFGGLIIHVAQANYGLGGAISGIKPDVDTASLANVKDKDKVIEALRGSFAFVHKAISAVTPENAFESVRSRLPVPMTRTTLAAFVVVHIGDEYGQMVEYLRMNGIVPPASAKRPS